MNAVRSPVLTLPRLGLHALAVTTTFSAWVLIWIGGLVTSKGAGMTVPDWPTSFGYNMFLFPISQWTGGIFYEHTHRLIATGVGVLTVFLMIALFWGETRRWMKWLGIALLVMVMGQGLLGGLRVTLASNGLGFIHGCLAQAFLATLAAVSLFTSPWWAGVTGKSSVIHPVRLGWIKHVTAITLLIFLQLALGAAMRHAHAGLSITDFPTAYGSWWPHVTRDSLVHINEARVAAGQMPTTLVQIHLQMMHRVIALLILLGVISSTFLLIRKPQIPLTLKMWSALWSLLVVGQVALGIGTILSGKAADIATAHVAIGAVLLLAGVLQVLMARRWNQAHDLRCAEKNQLKNSPLTSISVP